MSITFCLHERTEIVPKGPHYGRWCLDCHDFRGWVPKDELGVPKRSLTSRPGVKPKMRALIFDRFGNACMACGRMAPDVQLQVDHIIPVGLAKKFGVYDDLIESDLNLAPMCEECNSGKSDGVFSARSIRLMHRCLVIAEGRRKESES
jgi:5-methylcytosine-specific restriction endonuclease McrA